MAAQSVAQSQTQSQSDSPTLLRRALLANSIFSALSGLFFLLGAAPISAFLGLDMPMMIRFLGVDLLIFGAIVYKVATASPINRTFATVIVALDVVWVIGSIALIFGNIVPLTTGGKWAIAIVADVVTCFAIAQYMGIRRMKK